MNIICRPSRRIVDEKHILRLCGSINEDFKYHVVTIDNPNKKRNRLVVGCITLKEGELIDFNVSERYRFSEISDAIIREYASPEYRTADLWKILVFIRNGFYVENISKTGCLFRNPRVEKWKMGERPATWLEYVLSPRRKLINGKPFLEIFKESVDSILPLNKEITIPSTTITFEELKWVIESFIDSDEFKSSKLTENDYLEIINPAKNTSTVKRLSKLLHDRYNYNMRDWASSHIGGAISDIESGFTFQFTDTVDWNPGKFGDSGSCWFPGNSGYHMLASLLNCGHGYAIKFFNPEGKPKGRCWVSIEHDCMYLFNFKGNLDNDHIVRRMAEYFGLNYVTNARVHARAGSYHDSSGWVIGQKIPDYPVTLTWYKGG